MHFSFTQNPLSLEMSGLWVCVANLQAVRKHTCTQAVAAFSRKHAWIQEHAAVPCSGSHGLWVSDGVQKNIYLVEIFYCQILLSRKR